MLQRLSLWIFIKRMTYCGCCYGRYLWREKSWSVLFWPSPAPDFRYDECRGGWRFHLGWFLLWVVKPEFMSGKLARRK